MIARHDRACTTIRAASQSNVDLKMYKYNTRVR